MTLFESLLYYDVNLNITKEIMIISFLVSEGVSCGRAILFSVVSRGALRCC